MNNYQQEQKEHGKCGEVQTRAVLKDPLTAHSMTAWKKEKEFCHKQALKE